MVAEDAVAAFLFFGYLPRLDLAFQQRIVDAATAPPRAVDERDLVGAGVAALRAGFEDVAVGGGPHVVPLSGGLDSRAVLGGLLDAGVGERVVAVTVGTPGMLDFDLGRRVAEVAGVAHEQIDLRGVTLDADALGAALEASGSTSWAFDLFFHRLIPQHFGPDATYWSGFLGDALGGAHLPPVPAESWSEAVAHFAEHNRFAHLPELQAPGFSPGRLLPAQPSVDPGALSYTDQLDFGIRQASYIRPTVVLEENRYQTPFLHPEWVRFALALPYELRVGQRFYRTLLAAAYPKLFALPTKNTLGLPPGAPQWLVNARLRWWKLSAALRTRPRLGGLRRRNLPPPFRLRNYVDFATAIERRPDVRGLVHDTVHALDKREAAPWVNGAELLRRYGRAPGNADVATALTLLCSLELNLRVDERRPQKRFALEG